jgi:preprotein translocase subunit SecE
MADGKKATTLDQAGKQLPAPTVRAQRGGPIQFIREVRSEIAKVTWPTWKETYLTTIMVFIMVGLLMLFFFFVDYVLAYGERLLISAAG